MIRVHHLDSSKLTPAQHLELALGHNTSQFNELVRELWETGAYTCVAHHTSDNMNDAFRATNSVEGAWYTDPVLVPGHVQPKFTAPGCRSTSVGDVMTVDSELCYRIWAVAPMGFNLIVVGPPRPVSGRNEETVA